MARSRPSIRSSRPGRGHLIQTTPRGFGANDKRQSAYPSPIGPLPCGRRRRCSIRCASQGRSKRHPWPRFRRARPATQALFGTSEQTAASPDIVRGRHVARGETLGLHLAGRPRERRVGEADRAGRQHPRHRDKLEDSGSDGRVLALEPQGLVGLTAQDRQAAVVPPAAGSPSGPAASSTPRSCRSARWLRCAS